jgi:hypothetical protein
MTLYRPENSSAKSTPTIAPGFIVDDAGPLDKCLLYGDWGGWHLEEIMTAPVKGWPNINYFTPITFGGGTYWWYVTCNDTTGNMGYSANFTFNVTLTAPSVTLTNPPPAAIRQRGSVTFNYTVTQSEADVGIDNCTLYINSSYNQTRPGPVPKGVPQNFTIGNMPYGAYIWTVHCIANNTKYANSSRFYYVMDLNLTAPANDTAVDRDSILASPDIITLNVSELSGLNGTTIIFRANITSPNIIAGKNLTLGTNFTNPSGKASLTLDPEWSMLAGNYTWWAEIQGWNITSLNKGTFLVYGGIDIAFNSSNNPNASYGSGQNVTIDATVRQMGNETYAQLINSYGLNLSAVLYSPVSGNFTKALPNSSNLWTTTVNVSLLNQYGNWNATVNGTLTSPFIVVNSSAWRIFLLNLTADAAVSQIFNLNDSQCLPFFYYPVSANLSNLGSENLSNLTVSLYVNASLYSNMTVNLSGSSSTIITFWWKSGEGTYNLTVSVNVSSTVNDSNPGNNNRTIYNLIRDNLKISQDMQIGSLDNDYYGAGLTLRNNGTCNLSLASYGYIPTKLNGTSFYPIPASNTTYANGTAYVWRFNLTGFGLQTMSYNMSGTGNYSIRSAHMMGLDP